MSELAWLPLTVIYSSLLVQKKWLTHETVLQQWLQLTVNLYQKPWQVSSRLEWVHNTECLAANVEHVYRLQALAVAQRQNNERTSTNFKLTRTLVSNAENVNLSGHIYFKMVSSKFRLHLTQAVQRDRTWNNSRSRSREKADQRLTDAERLLHGFHQSFKIMFNVVHHNVDLVHVTANHDLLHSHALYYYYYCTTLQH